MADEALQGGEALAKVLAGLSSSVQNATAVKVGFLEGATYPDGTPVALVAAAQNYGVRDAAPGGGAGGWRIPPRPFFDQMIAANEAGWPALVAEGLQRFGLDARKALEFAGQIMSEQLQASILEGDYAPLAPSTIARKGFAKALVDTAHMLRSVDKEVT